MSDNARFENLWLLTRIAQPSRGASGWRVRMNGTPATSACICKQGCDDECVQEDVARAHALEVELEVAVESTYPQAALEKGSRP